MTALRLSIIIVNWNTGGLLADCLDSIYRAPPDVAYEVLVIDNASTDGSHTGIVERHPQARVIKNPSNIGFAAANNLGIRQSGGDLVVLLNPDTIVQPGALDRLTSFMDANPHVGAAGPRLLNPDGSLQPSCYPTPTLTRELWRLFHLDALLPYGEYAMQHWDLDRPRGVDVIKGACLVVRRKALDQVGLLDEDYFMYTEEVDLCLRLQKAAWQRVWVPQAEVIHLGGQSTRHTPELMFLHLYQSKVVFFRKHHSPLAVHVYKLVLLAASLVRLSLSPLAFLETSPRREEHLSVARNYRRLIAQLPAM